METDPIVHPQELPQLSQKLHGHVYSRYSHLQRGKKINIRNTLTSLTIFKSSCLVTEKRARKHN